MTNALVQEKITSDFAKHILLLLRDTSRSHIVLAIVDDSISRSEAMGELGDHLKEKYALYYFDYVQKGGQSLPRFCREKAGNAVFAFGLAELKQRDAEKYNDALHFLNAHREDIRDSKTAVVLWLNTGVYRDVLQLSPDFADWCISVPFKTTEEENDLLRQAQRFEEMLARPNLNMALAEEFLNQLTTIRKKQLAHAQRRFGQMRYKREVTVFIASAGDVAEERAIVRAVCDTLNRRELVGSYGMTFKAVGWEDVMPSPGRPQETINRRVEDCDVFVCVFNKRFGSFTGKEESGTVEEFRLAFDNWSRSAKPHVMVYFKEIKIGSLLELKDEQLQKVLEFKDWIGKEKNLLYAVFTTSDDFRQRFSADMERWIVENAKAMTPEERKLPVQKSLKTLEIPAAYKTWVIDHCSYMGIDRLKEKGEVIQVRLPEIFIPLYAYPPAKKSCPPGVDGVSKKTAMPEQLLASRAMGGMGEREQVRDIEELVGENRYLLIEGHPGSGKTTLLKHLSYSLVQHVEVKGLSGFLPILIFLKDVRGYFEKNKDARPKASTAEEMMAYYFNETENGLDVETALAFCDAERAVFLLDGLDEIAEGKDRDLTVASFADFMGKRGGVKVVFSGRAHSMDGAVIERFGVAHLSIQSLNMEQVQDFIRKWFAYIHHQGSKVGVRTAEEMIGSVKTHQGIDAFVGNPLMLTAICILYHDGRELPDQRAELYKRFVDNLLYKRFPRPEKVNAFLKKLAFEMHARGVRGVDRITAINTLKSIYEQDAKPHNKCPKNSQIK